MRAGLPEDPDPRPTKDQYRAAAVGLASTAAGLLVFGLLGWLGWATLRGHVALSLAVGLAALACLWASRR